MGARWGLGEARNLGTGEPCGPAVRRALWPLPVSSSLTRVPFFFSRPRKDPGSAATGGLGSPPERPRPGKSSARSRALSPTRRPRLHLGRRVRRSVEPAGSRADAAPKERERPASAVATARVRGGQPLAAGSGRGPRRPRSRSGSVGRPRAAEEGGANQEARSMGGAASAKGCGTAAAALRRPPTSARQRAGKTLGTIRRPISRPFAGDKAPKRC